MTTLSKFARKVRTGIDLNDETLEDARVFVAMYLGLHGASYAEFGAEIGLCGQTVQRFCEFDTERPQWRSVRRMLEGCGITNIRAHGDG